MPRVGFSAIVDDIEKLVDAEVQEYEELVVDNMSSAYEMLMDLSPVLTAYYKANHSIVLRRGGSLVSADASLEPPEKNSEERNFYEALVSARAAEELDKLRDFQAGDTIRLVTIVPYADMVEALHGTYATVAEAFNLRLR